MTRDCLILAALAFVIGMVFGSSLDLLAGLLLVGLAFVLALASACERNARASVDLMRNERRRDGGAI